MHTSKKLIAFSQAILALLLLILGWSLSKTQNLYYTGAPKISRVEARVIVDSVAAARGYEVDGLITDLYFARDISGIEFLTRQLGASKLIEIAEREQVPVSYWAARWYRNVPRDSQEEWFEIRLSASGHLLSFLHRLPDSVAAQSISHDEAIKLAEAEMATWTRYPFSSFELEKSTTQNKAKRTDHFLTYKRVPSEWGEGGIKASLRVTGDALTYCRVYFSEPDDFTSVSGVFSGGNLFLNTLSVLVYVLLTFMLIGTFLRRYHEGKITIRRGLIAGGILFAALLIRTLNFWDPFGLGSSFGPISTYYSKLILLGIQIATTFVLLFLAGFSALTAGDYEIRKWRPQLMDGVDSILNRKWLSKNIGREIPVGMLAGAALFGVVQLLRYLQIEFLGGVPRYTFEESAFFSEYWPFVSLFTLIVFYILYTESIFRKFLIPYLFNRSGKLWVAIGGSAMLFALHSIFFESAYGLSSWPAWQSLILYLVIGTVQGLIFSQIGFLAAITSGGFMTLLSASGPYIETGVPHFVVPTAILFVMVGAIFVVGLIGLYRGKHYQFKVVEEPAHIRRIKEQTRMQQELEIARKVQLDLLPKGEPKLAGYDISGISIPALEVGGDYFDFIHLVKGNLGIAIGDVSGKGVPAAIYMTLTKGVLQSHAESELSPKQVLAKVNSLMYRNMDRTWYVSMFYAVLDTDRRKLLFSRAGHNPAIVLSQGKDTPSLLQTAGIGIGLEKGDIFQKTLIEGELDLNPGDTLVFYTDGFTEAMNRQGDEYGEDRFLDFLHKNNNGSARQLLEKSIRDVQDFAGDAPQHDDMTMVVLKVN